MTDNIETLDTKVAPVPDHTVVDEQTKSERPPLVGERFRDRGYLAIIVAMLSFFMGGAGGTFLAFRFESDKWQRETSFTVRRRYLESVWNCSNEQLKQSIDYRRWTSTKVRGAIG